MSAGMTASDAIKRMLLAYKDRDYFRCGCSPAWGYCMPARDAVSAAVQELCCAGSVLTGTWLLQGWR